jgi:hypothetical protein
MALLAAAAPTAITWAVEVAGLAHLTNLARMTAALPLGAVVAGLVIATASGRLR